MRTTRARPSTTRVGASRCPGVWCVVGADRAVAATYHAEFLAPFQRKVEAEARTWRVWWRGLETPGSIYTYAPYPYPYPYYYYIYTSSR